MGTPQISALAVQSGPYLHHNHNTSERMQPTETVSSLCPYCGVGCGLEAVPQGKGTYKIRGDRQHPSSQGMVCVKGATILEAIDRDRLAYPLWRERLDHPFTVISWDEALTRLVERIQWVRHEQGADAICMYGSGQFHTEDYYVAQKLMKGCLGTNNFDANSRLCMSSAVSAYMASFGADGPPCCYDDLEATDCAFLIGTNTAECHPIVFNRLRNHHKRDRRVKLIVVDPRRTPTAEVADLHLAIRPGTDIDLLHGIGYLLLQWGHIDVDFIEKCTEGFADYVKLLAAYTPEWVAQRCGIPESDLEQAARYWGHAQAVLSLWSMGINQSAEGTAKARCLINLHLLTGQIGRPGSGPFSLTGQPNAMGGREAGGLSHLLPGYRQVTNPQHRQEVEDFWGLPRGQISDRPGRTAWQIIEGLEQGEVGLLWIAATNPAVSFPHLERTKAAFLKSPFTVYQDAYFPTETAAYAHLILPAAQWSEKTGVMTNSERRVTLAPAFRVPPGLARSDWEIFAEVGRRLGYGHLFSFADAAAVYAEFVQLTAGRPCDQSGLSHERLARLGALQWPCPASMDDEEARKPKRLYTDWRFHTPNQRAYFCLAHSQGVAEPTDHIYNFTLTTGRLYGHWHTQTRTGRIAKIQKMHPNPFVEMHPEDAANLHLQDGDWVEVRSRRGQVCLPVTLTKAIRPGTLFVPMHWGFLFADSGEVNQLTHPIACPVSKQPELKACAVQVLPLKLQQTS
ncbi:nitrate reductase [Thermosynechococcus vestitus BP-1]|uniref:Nitrate reductase n=2 Tax=Thermosynechococcus vestitus TaxID=146786 RepID=Q8DJ73_THEVB|nr:nitrate reductase [Thermosynechococcus vestitus]BAC08907.1 nitrate reductase [Thermosynechococcus vestitus BP-1]